jgi:hypothetical protein
MDTEIKQRLHENKPNLSEGSIKTYVSLLKSLYHKTDHGGSGIKFFDEYPDDIIKHLQGLTPSLRKTKLAALVSLTANHPHTAEKYRNLMLRDVGETNAEERKQKKTPKQEANWMSWKDVESLYKQYYRQYAPLLKKANPSRQEYEHLMDLILLGVYTLIPPRRSADYVDFKIKDIDKEKDNYMSGNEFIFNAYKTSKVYHQQKVKIPRALQILISKWTKINPSSYLLFDRNNNKWTIPKLTIKMNKIFGKKVSSTMLRHIFISDKVLENVPALSELDKVAQDMGHSSNQQSLYRKL